MRSSEPDFTRRVEPADLPEWLDEPRPHKQLRAYLRSLEQVNTLTLGARPTLTWLSDLVKQRDRREITIVDVGCGSGDMLRRIERWAKLHSLAVKLVGIDLSEETIKLAREWSSKGSRIEWVVGDAYAYNKRIDIVVSALLTHHLSEPDIVRLLSWMEATARRGWYINDLCRERAPYKIFSLAGAVLRWHKMVRHDGPVSFRRSFREEDWLRMVALAGIDPQQVTIRRWTPGRLCLGTTKSSNG